MEGEKRKRDGNGEMDGKRRKKGEDFNAAAGRQTQTVTENEVEEFYAILRRIRVAVKYFEKRNKEGPRQLTDTRWRPRFEVKDFDDHNGVNDDGFNNNNGGQKEEGTEGLSGFDLNSDPASS